MFEIRHRSFSVVHSATSNNNNERPRLISVVKGSSTDRWSLACNSEFLSYPTQYCIMSSQGSAASGSSRGGAGRGFRGGGRGGGGRGRGLPSSSLAAIATAPLRNQAGYASYVVPKAKNVVNQPLLQILAESRSKIDPTRNKFALTLKSAMDNLAKHPDAVATYKQACLVRGIGKKIAHMLFPTDDNNDNDNDNGIIDGERGGRYGSSSSANDDPNNKTTIDGGGVLAEAAESRKRMRQTTLSDAMFASATLPSSSSQLSASSPQGSVASNASSTTSNPTRRQVQYHREATQSSHQLWKNQNLMWNVLFVVDNREKKDGRDRLCDKFSSANIPFEVRQLPIGDMTWIAQGRKRRHSNNNDSSPTKGPVVVELVLGTIIERKTLVDLTASIHGTRYAEQRMRMVQSGLSQCILLLEGNVHRESTTSSSECHHKRLDACHTALWETCLYLNFQILRTADMGETISTLKLMHRRILQRSFPQAFSSEVLPTFDEPGAIGGGGGGGGPQRQGGVQWQQQHALEVGQRKRRRYQSLHKLVFDTDPVVPPGMDRFVTYNELKAKVGRDREAGLRTVRMVHGAMVKQVPKIENKRAAAIVHAYPTPTLLFEAYHQQQTEQHKQLLLRDLDTSMVATTADDGTTSNNCSRPTIRKCTVGLEGSKQMYMAYGMSKKASERPSYAEQVERVQQEQQEQRRKSSGSSSSERGGGGEGSSGEKKRPAAASSSSLRDSRNPSASPSLDNDWYGLSHLSEASSHSAAAVTLVAARLAQDESSRDAQTDPRRLEFTEHSSRTGKAPPPKQSTSAVMRKKPPPIPPAAAASRTALASANPKPPPAASNQGYRRRSPSQQESLALGSSQASAASSNLRGVLVDRPARGVACAAPVHAPSQEAVIDLCDDDSSDDDGAYSYERPRTPAEDVAGGGGNPKDEDDAGTEEDDDDDYDYSPVVKKPAAPSTASIREPLSSLCNGSPTRPRLPSLSAASANRRPILNPYAKSNKSRYSLGSLSVSTSASSSTFNSAAPVAAAPSSSSNGMPRSQQPTGGRRRASLTLDELGLGSSSSDDDNDGDDNTDRDGRRRRTAAEPAPIAAAALPPRRKAREPEVYEILSD
jgi:ERCC4-type nuclease